MYDRFSILSSLYVSRKHHFTGKERDAESGNDYFGARYYASSMGRFLSPDPLLNSGRPNDPQSWNRYSYARNNPLEIVDPTGLYNLDSGCLKDKKCAVNAKTLRDGIAKLTKGVNGMKDGAEKTRLQGALKTLGTQNDGNNVAVAFGKLGGTAAGHTDVLTDAGGNLSGFKIRSTLAISMMRMIKRSMPRMKRLMSMIFKILETSATSLMNIVLTRLQRMRQML